MYPQSRKLRKSNAEVFTFFHWLWRYKLKMKPSEQEWEKKKKSEPWWRQPMSRKEEGGSCGWEKEGMSSSISKTSPFLLSSPLPLFFSCLDTFPPPTTGELFPTRGVHASACADMCLSECISEVRLGGGLGGMAIKALLKHFWCCWPTLQLKEGERKKKKKGGKKKPQSKGSETVREVEREEGRECAHTQRRARHA